MNNFNLYVTDSAPNGTNDLLVCNAEHKIVAVVEEATFGIDVMKHRSPVNDLIATPMSVISLPRGEEKPEDWTYVRAIDVNTLKRMLCVSPVDPDGADVLNRLKKAGVKL